MRDREFAPSGLISPIAWRTFTESVRASSSCSKISNSPDDEDDGSVHGQPPFGFSHALGPEPRTVPRRTESADKSDALQTLRAVRRRQAVAKRLECVRLQRRFPRAGEDENDDEDDRSVHGNPLSLFACVRTMNRESSRAGRKAPINRTHSRRFARFGDARQSRSVWSARA